MKSHMKWPDRQKVNQTCACLKRLAVCASKKYWPSKITFPFLALTWCLVASSVYAAAHYQRLRSFGFPDLGTSPEATVIEGSDGSLYGTASAGGGNNAGVIFKIGKDGTGYSLLRSFQRDRIDGQDPVAQLIEGSDGYLYGTTQVGGSNSGGTIFKISKDGTNYSVLHSFEQNGVDGQMPSAAPFEGPIAAPAPSPAAGSGPRAVSRR